MNLTLIRTDKKESGIYGKLLNPSSSIIAVTLEHAYPVDTGWEPKIPIGGYSCVRGQHQLHSMAAPFETFEITKVPGHTNCLIHMGNFDRQSEGCVLVGKAILSDMITHSLDTFNAFMALQDGINEFNLTIQD